MKLTNVFGVLMTVLATILVFESPNLICYSPDQPELKFCWAFDISANGSAFVSVETKSWSGAPFNLTVPVTSQELEYTGDFNLSRIFLTLSEVSDGCNCLELTPSVVDEASIFVDYVWPDCAVPYNGTYYVGANEVVKLYPDQILSTSNITILFPEDA